MNLPPIHLNDESLQIINNIYNTLRTHSSYSGCDFELENYNSECGTVSIKTFKNSYPFYSYSFYSKTIRDGTIGNIAIHGGHLQALLKETVSSMEIFGLPIESATIRKDSVGYIYIHLQPYELSQNWLTKKSKIKKKEKNRDYYCDSAFVFYQTDLIKGVEWFEMGLSKPFVEGSKWADERISCNIGLGKLRLGNYEEAYSALVNAYNGGVKEGYLIKEINWLNGFFQIEKGEIIKFTDFVFQSSNQKTFKNETEASLEKIQSIINISLSSDKKRIKLGVVSILQTQYASLTLLNPNSSDVHTYISDDSEFAFHITYSDENKIDQVGIQMLGDRNLLVEYYK